MKISISQITEQAFDGKWNCIVTIEVGDAKQLFVGGCGATQVEAQAAASKSFARAVENLDQIAEVWRVHGQLDWRALGGRS